MEQQLISLKERAHNKAVSPELIEQAHLMFCVIMKYDVAILAMIIDDLESRTLEEILSFLTSSSHYTETFSEMIKNRYWQKINQD